MSKTPTPTLEALQDEAAKFAQRQRRRHEPELFGVTDGKAVGTHIESGFKKHLAELYSYERGNAARGIDFPGLGVDIKVTSIEQPQSSCPFKGARQKIYGLGYSLLVLPTRNATTKGRARRGSTFGIPSMWTRTARPTSRPPQGSGA